MNDELHDSKIPKDYNLNAITYGIQNKLFLSKKDNTKPREDYYYGSQSNIDKSKEPMFSRNKVFGTAIKSDQDLIPVNTKVKVVDDPRRKPDNEDKVVNTDK